MTTNDKFCQLALYTEIFKGMLEDAKTDKIPEGISKSDYVLGLTYEIEEMEAEMVKIEKAEKKKLFLARLKKQLDDYATEKLSEQLTQMYASEPTGSSDISTTEWTEMAWSRNMDVLSTPGAWADAGY